VTPRRIGTTHSPRLDEPAAAPGLDLHEWESQWASIGEGAEDDPDAALSQLADLVRKMLVESGHEVGDPVARSGEEPEVIVTYLSARQTAERAEVGAASRAEVEIPLDDLRWVFETIAGAHRRR